MIDGVIFPFTRETFNWICSDISQFLVPRAVAALEMSSTVMVNMYNFETIDLLRRNIKD